jgi:hypothetical protein
MAISGQRFAAVFAAISVWFCPCTAVCQYYWSTNDGGITITGYYGDGGSIAIPDSINGLPVTRISGYAFESQTNLNVVTIPDTVTNIGPGAFAYCSGLFGVNLPSNITTIASNTFYDCFQLTGIEIPSRVASIGDSAFYSCPSLRQVRVPDSVKTIGNAAFAGCWRLTNAVLGAGVTSVSSDLFGGCTALAKVVLASGITNIGYGAFYNCSRLRSIVIPAAVTFVNGSAFGACSAMKAFYFLGNAPAFASYAFPFSYATVFYMPGTRGWGPTFNYLPTVPWNPRILPNSVRLNPTSNTFEFAITGTSNLALVVEACSDLRAGDWANIGVITLLGGLSQFKDTSPTSHESRFYRLAAAEISDYDYVITNGSITLTAFYGDGYSVEIPSYINGLPVSAIGLLTFRDYQSTLTNVVVPDTVQTLEDSAFGGCGMLTSIKLGSGLRVIGPAAFDDCTSLAEILIPKATTNIADDAFEWCWGLQQINVEPGSAAFSSVDGVLFDASGKQLLQFPAGRGGSYWVPGGTTNIAHHAFNSRYFLTDVVLPAGLFSIGEEAFRWCNRITNIYIPDSVAIIGAGSFGGCTSVSNIYLGTNLSGVPDLAFNGASMHTLAIPEGITNIGRSAFEQCFYITNVQIGASVRAIGSNAFNECYRLRSVNIPAATTNISSAAFVNCQHLSAINVDPANPSYRSSDGAVLNWAGTELVVFPGGKLGNYIIPDGVKTILPWAFSYSFFVTNVTFPPTLLSIGDYSFYQSLITSADIPDSVQTIGNWAFAYASLQTVSIGDGVTNIGNAAFASCRSLTNVVVGAGVNRLGEIAFGYCYYLRSAYFKGDAPASSGYTFDNTPATVYYVPGTSGWGTYYDQRPTAPWNP